MSSYQKVQLTANEVRAAFYFFSSDGKKITKDDLKEKIDIYFPGMPLHYYKQLISGHGLAGARLNGAQAESMTLPMLLELMGLEELEPQGNYGVDGVPSLPVTELSTSANKKNLLEGLRYDEAFNLLQPNEEGHIPEAPFRNAVSRFNESGKLSTMLIHYDHDVMLKEFDKDKDGHLGLDDFIHMMNGYKIDIPKLCGNRPVTGHTLSQR